MLTGQNAKFYIEIKNVLKMKFDLLLQTLKIYFTKNKIINSSLHVFFRRKKEERKKKQ